MGKQASLDYFLAKINSAITIDDLAKIELEVTNTWETGDYLYRRLQIEMNHKLKDLIENTL